jgi:predicted ATPase/DNA-binding SARP family transcriptional activator
MHHEPHLELTLLGRASLRVARGSQAFEVTLPTRKSLALLAYLALNGTTTRAELSSLLWGDNTDAEARKNLRQDVYRLQSTPIGAWLEADRHRLGLRGSFSVDARRLREAAALGDLGGVLALHRGVLLEGLSLPGAVEFEGWLEAERESLSRLYRDGLMARARDLERDGDLRGAIVTLERLVRHDALQEATQRELMRLHWQLGERVEALERFTALETLLRDEMGLRPAPETLALERQIRNAMQPIASVTPRRLPAELPFVGRSDALAWLEARTTGLSLLTGEPGIGKTRLAQEFARTTTPDTARILHLRGFETSSGTPYYPITSALLEHFERHPSSFDALRPAWRREVERLLPGHDGRTREPPPAEGRGWFLEALAQTLVALAGESGCIVLDDLHWFDAPSLEVLTHLLRRPHQVRLVATARRETQADRPATRTLETLVHTDGQHLELEPLTRADLVALLHRLSGPHIAALLPYAARLYDAVGGNPLFLIETLRTALDAGSLRVDDGGWLTLTGTEFSVGVVSSVRDAINRRVERLGADLKRLLEAASLLAEPFKLEELRLATELDSWTVLAAFERALEWQLVEGSAHGYRFAQTVTRTALADGLGTQRKAWLHGRLAQALNATNGSAAQIAAHFERAGQNADAVPHWIRAAHAAAHAYAYREALEAYARALENDANPTDHFELRLARAKLLEYLDDREAWALELQHLERLNQRVQTPTLIARVSLASAEFEFHHGRYDATLERLRPLIDAADLDADLGAAALYRSGMALVRLGRLNDARTLLERALSDALSDTLSDGLERCAAIRHALSITAFHSGDLELASQHNRAALEAFRILGDERGQGMTLSFAGRLSTSQGQPEAALEVLQSALELARGAQFVPLLRSTLLNIAAVLLNNGDYERAQEYLEEGRALAHEPQDPRMAGLYLTHSSAAYRARGDLGKTIEAYRAALELFDLARAMHPAAFERLSLAELLLECGDTSAARGVLQAAANLIETHGFSDLRIWVEALELRASIAEETRIDLRPLETSLREPDRLRFEIRQEALLSLAEGQRHSRRFVDSIATASRVTHPPEARARALATLLHARVATETNELNDDIEEAKALLHSNRVMPVTRLGLRRAMNAALTARGDTDAAASSHLEMRTMVANLAQTLEPNARALFVAHWRREPANPAIKTSPRLEAAD